MPDPKPPLSQPSALSGLDFDTWLPEDTPAPLPAPEGAVVPSRYTDQGLLGTGGMGEVRRVRDQDLGRTVAMKIIHPHLAGTASAVQRFLAEARTTANLEHPGIAPVHEVGQLSDDRLYFTMREIRGQTLGEVMDQWSLRQLVAAFAQVCETVAYAHSRGVLHRDLKPDNVMVGDYGEVLVVDWGLGKVRADEAGDSALLEAASPLETVQGRAMGTPAYMSPEQSRGEPVDARSDVWSLGVILYRILTGTLPFDAPSIPELLVAVSAAPLRPVGERVDRAPAELAAITHKALSRDPAGRYADAGEVAAEVRAWLDGDWVTAHEYTSWELVQRFVARNRVLTGSAVLIAVLIGVSAGGLLQAWLHAEQARSEAEEARSVAEANEREAHRNLAAGYRAQAERLLEKGEPLSAAVFAAASLLHDPAHPGSPWAWEPLTDPLERAHHLDSAEAALYAGRTSWLRHDATLLTGSHTGLSSDGLHGAVLSEDGLLRLVDLATGEELHRWAEVPVEDGVLAVSDRCVVTSSDAEGLRLWTATGGPVALHAQDFYEVSFSPDGAWLAGANGDPVVSLWDGRTGAHVADLEGHTAGVEALDFAPDGTLATGSGDHTVRAWSMEDHRSRVVATFPDSVLNAVRWLDDERVMAGDLAGRVMIGGPQGVRLVGRHDAPIYSLDVRDDGLLASGDDIGQVRLWTLDGVELARTTGHGCPVQRLVFTGDALLTRPCRHVERWSVGSPVRVLEGHVGEIWAIAHDGVHLYTGGDDGTVRRWDGATGTVLARRDTPVQAVESIPGLAVVAWEDGYSALLDLEGGPTRELALDHHAPLSCLALAPGKLASADYDGGIRLWALPSGEPIGRLEGHEAGVWSVEWSADGSRLLSSGLDGTVRTWSVETQSQISELAIDPDVPTMASWSPDEAHVVLGGFDPRVVRADTGEVVAPLTGHRGWVGEARYSPDGAVVLTSSVDGTARVWDAQTGAPVLTLPQSHPVSAVLWTPDGVALATDATVRVAPLIRGLAEGDPAAVLAEAEAEANSHLEGFTLLERPSPNGD